MKIYDSTSFLMGILWLCAIPLFALGIIEGGWLRYTVAISFSAVLFYRAFSKTASERDRIKRAHFKETAISLYGRLYFIKTDLPWILIFVFFPVALTLRLVFHIWLPIWVGVVFVSILTVSTLYSIGIIDRIRSDIEENARKDG